MIANIACTLSPGPFSVTYEKEIDETALECADATVPCLFLVACGATLGGGYLPCFERDSTGGASSLFSSALLACEVSIAWSQTVDVSEMSFKSVVRGNCEVSESRI